MAEPARAWPWALAAVGLAAGGVVATLVRPLAPPLPPVSTDLDRFAAEVVAAVAAYRGPRRPVVLATLAVGAAVPVAAATLRTVRCRLDRFATGPRPVLRGAALSLGLAVAADLATFPAVFWLGYVHDGRWGFRTAGIGGWLRDWAITRGAGWLIVAAGGAAFVAAVGRWPSSWPWRAVVAGTAAAAVLTLAGPYLLEPLLLDTRPLPPGPTREAVAAVLARAGEPDVPIVVGDASRRTTRVNAYVSGLGPSRRVVIYDNLLDLPADQVALVVAHELGHRHHRDIVRGVLLTATGLLPLSWAIAAVVTRRRDRGGAGAVVPAAALAAVALVVALPAGNLVSRRAEAAADQAALRYTGEPAAMVRLARTFVVRDLADPHPPAWLRLVVGTHPTPVERIRAAVAYARRHGLPLPTRQQLTPAEEAVTRDRLPGPVHRP